MHCVEAGVNIRPMNASMPFAALQNLDLKIMIAIHSCSNPALTWLSWFIAMCAWGGAFAWIVVAAFWLRGKRQFAKLLTLALIIGIAESEILKHLLHRIRPSEVYPHLINLPLADLGQAKYSCPSAHSLLAAAFAFIIFHHVKSWKAATIFLIPITVGFVRIYQGMHWPSDVLLGYLLGGITAWLVIAISPKALNAADTAGKTSQEPQKMC